MTQLTITSAYILDLILGDPHWLPHPVKGIGWLIKKLEQILRKVIKNEHMGGVILAAIVIGITYVFTFLAVKYLYHLNFYFGIMLSILLIYTTLAVKDLRVESMVVYHSLEKKDTASARSNLAKIVGRDTQNLDEPGIIRATVETVAESTVDGIISPLFYAFIGGAPLALAYKAVNTLDSMVGYKSDRYRFFGWASAKIDDLANFIPARISAILFPLASWLAGKDGFNSLRIILRDGAKNPSPNSGIPEAAVAGALRIQLGGLNFYNSTPIAKPLIGDFTNPLEINHIGQSIKISFICSGLMLIIGTVFFEIWNICRI